MATIPQRQLFRWQEIEELGDLERLRLVLDHLPDEPLMEELERRRGYGRDDYPIRAVWNSVLAGIVFQHQSTEQLRRELSRNGQLRWLCGFDLLKGLDAVPEPSAYSRFFGLLKQHADLVDEMFDSLVEQLREVLPDFGRILALGFESDRETLKYRCPARQYGLECKGRRRCPVRGSVRIKLEEDRRIFTPLARSSYRWKTLYKKRTSVERVNSRLDVSFGFEQHFIRGLKKMRLRMGLALIVMLAMALGRAKEKRLDRLRSLTRVA